MPTIKHRVDLILEKVEGPLVLDVGCTGHDANPDRPYWLHGLLRQKFENVEGIDINRENVEKLRRVGYWQIHCARIEEWHPPHRYNAIVVGGVIEHVGDAVSFLRRAAELVENGGRLSEVRQIHSVSCTYHMLLRTIRGCVRIPSTRSGFARARWPRRPGGRD